MKNHIKEIMICPDCGGNIDKYNVCISCKRKYEYNNFIYEMIPLKSLSLPSAYDDINYVAYNRILSETDEYFYKNKNPIIRWVSEAGHKQVRKYMKNNSGLVLDCGCGNGVHLKYNEKIEKDKYIMLDIDKMSLEKIIDREIIGGVIHGDNYNIPFKNNVFDTVISVSQLEHLCYLDLALSEIKRVLKKDGEFICSIPTEGGLLWSFGRKITTAKYFGKKLNIDYVRGNLVDHFNTIHQIERSIKRYFNIRKRIIFPFIIPSFDLNLICTYKLSSF